MAEATSNNTVSISVEIKNEIRELSQDLSSLKDELEVECPEEKETSAGRSLDKAIEKANILNQSEDANAPGSQNALRYLKGFYQKLTDPKNPVAKTLQTVDRYSEHIAGITERIAKILDFIPP